MPIVRRQGHSPPDAQDLTQEFFARLLEKDYLKAAAQEKGRFRTFLIVALKRFLANEWDRARAQKRGGGQVVLSLDTELAEQRYRIEPVAGLHGGEGLRAPLGADVARPNDGALAAGVWRRGKERGI